MAKKQRNVSISYPFVALIVAGLLDIALTITLAGMWWVPIQQLLPNAPIVLGLPPVAVSLILGLYLLPEAFLGWWHPRKLFMLLGSMVLIKAGLLFSAWQLWTKGFDLLWLHMMAYLLLVILTILFNHLLMDDEQK